MFTRSNLAHYLMGRGLIARERVVDGNLMISEAKRRNRNFKVFVADGPGYFVKQADVAEPQSATSIAREAACHRLAQPGQPLARLQPWLPHLHVYDPARDALVFELLAGESLAQHHLRTTTPPPFWAARLGEALAACHGAPSTSDGMGGAALAPAMPWALSLDVLEETSFSALSGGGLALLRAVKSSPQIVGGLAGLRAGWGPVGLTHGDMKWDNCFINARADGEPRLRIVDWEGAGLGDPDWDVGSIVQAYMSAWLLGLGPSDPAWLSPAADRALAAARPAMTAFLDAYAVASPRTLDPVELRVRSLRYAAVRMLQTAYECVHLAERLTAPAVYLLQMSANIFADPEAAAGALVTA